VELGYAQKALGRNQEAVKSYREAIRLKPDHAVAHYYLGLTLVATGSSDEAMAEYRTLQRLNPQRAQQLLAEINKAR
jgi:Flp pilus assembly protein TadD